MTPTSGAVQSLGFQLTARLAALKTELALGERRLMALDSERQELRDTLLRISGAIQVLEEQLDNRPVPAEAAA